MRFNNLLGGLKLAVGLKLDPAISISSDDMISPSLVHCWKHIKLEREDAEKLLLCSTRSPKKGNRMTRVEKKTLVNHFNVLFFFLVFHFYKKKKKRKIENL